MVLPLFNLARLKGIILNERECADLLDRPRVFARHGVHAQGEHSADVLELIFVDGSEIEDLEVHFPKGESNGLDEFVIVEVIFNVIRGGASFFVFAHEAFSHLRRVEGGVLDTSHDEAFDSEGRDEGLGVVADPEEDVLGDVLGLFFTMGD